MSPVYLMIYKKGDFIDQRYHVEAVIGEGGNGVVYRTVDCVLSSTVAIKCLHPHIASEPGLKTRFLREAQAMARLSGTSAVQVFDFRKSSDGVLYIAMEFIEGLDLETYLYEIEQNGELIAVSELIDILSPIIETLEQAHALGIVHRDLKPSNIMLSRQRENASVKLLDFGLAKNLTADPLTLDGYVNGTPEYVAPEAWRGIPDIVDHRIDIYSMGVIIFRALTGTLPFHSQRPLYDFVQDVICGARPNLCRLRPDLPTIANQWIVCALSPDPNERFQTIQALWTAFTELRVGNR